MDNLGTGALALISATCALVITDNLNSRRRSLAAVTEHDYRRFEPAVTVPSLHTQIGRDISYHRAFVYQLSPLLLLAVLMLGSYPAPDRCIINVSMLGKELGKHTPELCVGMWVVSMLAIHLVLLSPMDLTSQRPVAMSLLDRRPFRWLQSAYARGSEFLRAWCQRRVRR